VLDVPEEVSVADAFTTGFKTVLGAFLSAAAAGAKAEGGWVVGAVDGLVTVSCLADG